MAEEARTPVSKAVAPQPQAASRLALSELAPGVMQSEIRAMTTECDRIGGINLAQGVCDTPVPAPGEAEAHAAIKAGHNIYTRLDGIARLRNAISAKQQRDYGLTYDAETEVLVASGATGGLHAAAMALLNPGDEVLLFEPFYGYHVNTLLAVDVKPKYVAMVPPDWSFTTEDLEGAVTPRTRGIMINTPGNPTGKVWTRAELNAIEAFAEKHDLYVFTDEVYEYLVYDGREHMSPATMGSLRTRTISMGSLSKTFSITGWRIGYAVADRRWSKMIGYMNDLVYVCAPAPLQMGVARALDQVPDSYYRDLCDGYRVKRDKICDALRRAGLTPFVPQGAYYVLADLSKFDGRSSKERAMKLLERTGVATVPGESFYREGRGETIARFCFAKTDDQLAEACRRLERL